jgi:hypothetical protein
MIANTIYLPTNLPIEIIVPNYDKIVSSDVGYEFGLEQVKFY